MSLRERFLAGVLATSMALGGATALAQDSTPMTSPEGSPMMDPGEVPLVGPEGNPIGTVTFNEAGEGLTIAVTTDGDSGLEPGEHGVHLHEYGLCTPGEGEQPFSDAGGHFNPTDAEHGGPDDEDSHAGDLGNLTVAEDGSIDFEITTDKVTLEPGVENSLLDEDGTALVIHANADDMETDPSGESGDRVACGVIFQHPAALVGTPFATPEGLETDAATPEN